MEQQSPTSPVAQLVAELVIAVRAGDLRRAQELAAAIEARQAAAGQDDAPAMMRAAVRAIRRSSPDVRLPPERRDELVKYLERPAPS
jgi:dihydrodipicolinate synthase/N-acetylneuraminate lyase